MQAQDDFLAVAAILQQYGDALYRGDTSRLAELFHPAASYFTASSGELLQLDMPAYLQVVADRPTPEDLGEPYFLIIDSIDFAGPVTAAARVRCRMLGKLYTDFLTLVRLESKWKILAKGFHYEQTIATR